MLNTPVEVEKFSDAHAPAVQALQDVDEGGVPVVGGYPPHPNQRNG